MSGEGNKKYSLIVTDRSVGEAVEYESLESFTHTVIAAEGVFEEDYVNGFGETVDKCNLIALVLDTETREILYWQTDERAGFNDRR